MKTATIVARMKFTCSLTLVALGITTSFVERAAFAQAAAPGAAAQSTRGTAEATSGVAKPASNPRASLRMDDRIEAEPEEAPMPDAPVAEPTPDAVDAPATYVVDNEQLVLVRGDRRVTITTPSRVASATLVGATLYVTHGDTTVSVYTCDDPERPTLTQTLTTGHGVATGVEVVGGKAWVVSVSKQAMPVEELGAGSMGAGQGPVTSPIQAAPSEPSASGSSNLAVKVVEPGVIEVAAGRQIGVRVGDRFALYRETSLGSGDNTFAGEELVAFAEVVAVKDESALAELSRTAIVRTGDVARPARADQTESNAYPVRVAHVGEVGGTLRPLINAGSPLGFGVLADVQGSYWGNGYFMNLMVQPLGLGWTDGGNVVSTSALLEGGYDGRAFSVGLGVGISTVNGDIDSMLSKSYNASAEDAGGVQNIDRQQTHSAFTLSQSVRLGARDGLNLAVRNLLMLHDDETDGESGFIYGGTTGKLTIPLDRRNDIFLEGGGGVMGYWLVGAGVGTWLVGNGSPGSWKLSISAGAAGIWGTKEVTTITQNNTYVHDEDVELAGPMVSFGVTRRFGL